MSTETVISNAGEHSDLIPVIVGASIGVVVTIIGSFLKKSWEHLTRPNLHVTFGSGTEYQTKTQTTSGPLAIYLRLKVTNLPPTIFSKKIPYVNPIALSCRATLVGIEKFSSETGNFEPTIYVDNISLAWSCQIPNESWAVDIYPELPQFLDLLAFEISTLGRAVPFEPKLKLTPLRYSKELFNEHGQFRFTVQITGANVATTRKSVVLNWAGKADTYTAE